MIRDTLRFLLLDVPTTPPCNQPFTKFVTFILMQLGAPFPVNIATHHVVDMQKQVRMNSYSSLVCAWSCRPGVPFNTW